MFKKRNKKVKYKDIDHIDVVFENLEVATVPKEAIGNFFASGIKASISSYSNSVVEMEVADCLYLTILKEKAENIMCGFGFDDKYDTNLVNRTMKHGCDITSFHIYFNTGEDKQIYAPWEGDDDHVNEAQDVKLETDSLSKKGQEYLVIELKRK